MHSSSSSVLHRNCNTGGDGSCCSCMLTAVGARTLTNKGLTSPYVEVPALNEALTDAVPTPVALQLNVAAPTAFVVAELLLQLSGLGLARKSVTALPSRPVVSPTS